MVNKRNHVTRSLSATTPLGPLKWLRAKILRVGRYRLRALSRVVTREEACGRQADARSRTQAVRRERGCESESRGRPRSRQGELNVRFNGLAETRPPLLLIGAGRGVPLVKTPFLARHAHDSDACEENLQNVQLCAIARAGNVIRQSVVSPR
ncbi:hypothetical protein X777_12124 [Ooceraea biroi]|uniref:Uncharacterized protein n=1 Tax=Ooceraea biroi TaxID=2015173 RepID=A0A026W3F4_OOCBI|nr:hypothetical protein X777_12124 [Ooceraea biroi]